MGEGSGEFADLVRFAAPYSHWAVPKTSTIGDFDGNGLPDLAMVSGNVSVLLAGCAPR